MGQIVGELRRADAVNVDPAGMYVEIIRPADQLTPNEISRQFRYDPDAKRLTLRINFAGAEPNAEYELANHITACKFGPADMGADATNAAVPIRIPISLTCSIDTTSFTLHGSAAPRRAQRY
jgi:hypothetical protein